MSIDVQPGECMELEISTVPYTKEGTINYFIPILGGFSFWTEKPIKIPPSDSYHYNWNLPIQDFLEVATVSLQHQLAYEPTGLCLPSMTDVACF